LVGLEKDIGQNAQQKFSPIASITDHLS